MGVQELLMIIKNIFIVFYRLGYMLCNIFARFSNAKHFFSIPTMVKKCLQFFLTVWLLMQIEGVEKIFDGKLVLNSDQNQIFKFQPSDSGIWLILSEKSNI